MFWGVTLESGKRYTQVVDSTFHVSMAALEPLQKEPSEKYVKLMIEHRNADFLLCVLKYNDVLQVALDLNFVEGEEICFYLNGAEGTVHLSGYLSEFDNMPDLDEEDEADEENASDEEGSEDDDVPTRNKMLTQVKKKVKAKQKPEKKASVFDNSAGDEESSDEDVMPDEWENQSDDDSDEDEEDDEDSGGDDDDDDESEEEEVPKLVSQKRKRAENDSKKSNALKGKQEPKQQQKNESMSSVTTQEMSPEKAGTPSKRRQRNKKRKTEENNVAEKSSPAAGASKVQGGTVLAGGVRSQDLLVGSGPVAKRGKRVHVYYTGRLPNSNNKQFDACQSGKPFSFILGRGTVIKGWDTGIEGMKVGGKRRLVIPPSQGYANNRVGSIPANSMLAFDVELKAVS
ncbi:46 kDa FK506-binding nuclear protein-like isoform X2 [Ornithodoros turicata]|uniref:46 kDa FK506-binding nuclear protein-like isoform X2 n=1 Tax=Ornithodoros turicata TaxID=34597 RepID=UPI00313A108C